MSTKLYIPYAGPETNLYFQIFSREDAMAGRFWNTEDGSLDVFDDANIAEYDVVLTAVGDGTAGLFVGTIPGDLPAGKFSAVPKVRAGAAPALDDLRLPLVPFVWDGSGVVEDSPSAEWEYADQNDVSDAISAAGLAIMSNMENTDTDPVVARIQRAGNRADALMNGRLKAIGYAVTSGSIDLSDSNDAEILKEISVGIVLSLLARWRILQVADFGGNPRAVLDKLGENSWKEADSMLDRIATGNLQLTAERVIAGPQDNSTSLGIDGQPLYPDRWYGTPYWY